MAKNTTKDTGGGFQPTTFTRTDDDGTEHELTATSAADAVRLRFDGWREQKSASAKSGSKPAPTS